MNLRLLWGEPEQCWPWLGGKDGRGYGAAKVSGRMTYAHRYIWELCRGSIPDGHVIDHLCRNPGCVNPRHLEAVTQRENILRGTGVAAKNAAKMHCKEGHPLGGDNLYVNKSGRRRCATCARADSLMRWRRKNGKL